jgi:hypothetical protein
MNRIRRERERGRRGEVIMSEPEKNLFVILVDQIPGLWLLRQNMMNR